MRGYDPGVGEHVRGPARLWLSVRTSRADSTRKCSVSALYGSMRVPLERCVERSGVSISGPPSCGSACIQSQVGTIPSCGCRCGRTSGNYHNQLFSWWLLDGNSTQTEKYEGTYSVPAVSKCLRYTSTGSSSCLLHPVPINI